nr:MAG TPA: hypothetical protein [Crassvirales sp.]
MLELDLPCDVRLKLLLSAKIVGAFILSYLYRTCS